MHLGTFQRAGWTRILSLVVWMMGIGVWLCSCSAPASGPDLLFQDRFTQTPAGPWQWIRENPDTHRLAENGLQIMLEPGGLMGGGKDAKNLLVRPWPPEAKSVWLSLQARYESQYEQAGLLVYHDDDHYVKLVMEFVDGQTWIVFITEKNTEDQLIAKVPATTPPRLLGLEEKDDTLTAKVLWDANADFTDVGTCAFDLSPRPRIGLFAQSGQAGAERWVTFHAFALWRLPLAEALAQGTITSP